MDIKTLKNKIIKNQVQFPLLARLWRQIASIAGASADVERVFSISGWVTSARRWRLSPQSCRAIVLQHFWKQKVDQSFWLYLKSLQDN